MRCEIVGIEKEGARSAEEKQSGGLFFADEGVSARAAAPPSESHRFLPLLMSFSYSGSLYNCFPTPA